MCVQKGILGGLPLSHTFNGFCTAKGPDRSPRLQERESEAGSTSNTTHRPTESGEVWQVAVIFLGASEIELMGHTQHKSY